MKTVIIGAGPAGLATAVELAKHQEDFLIIEKDSQIGGLAKTYQFNEQGLIFRTDNGPHRFFSKNQFLYQFIENLLQEKWIEVKRQTRQYINGQFYDYPVRPAQALFNIGPKKAARMITDYLLAQFQYQVLKKPINNFESHIIANFGRSLGNFNMINYTEKIWGVPASTIHIDWAIQRIHGLNISFLMKAAFANIAYSWHTEKIRTLTDYFYYPEYGTGLIYDTIANQIKNQGYKILLNTQPTKINHHDNKINSITLNNGLTDYKINVTNLVESIPIKDFLTLLDPLPPPEIIAANQKIKYRDQVYLFLTFNKDRITHDQWIYFPEKNIPFGRISEMKNFSSKMNPPGKTSLFVEFFCFKNDDIWNKSKEELTKLTLMHLENLGFCKKGELRNSYHFKQEKVYPIYDIHYKNHIDLIKKYLDQFTNLYYIGRPGRFRYNNQDHSLEMGFLAAKSIIENKRYDLEQVGAEKEYYEKTQLINSLHSK